MQVLVCIVLYPTGEYRTQQLSILPNPKETDRLGYNTQQLSILPNLISNYLLFTFRARALVRSLRSFSVFLMRSSARGYAGSDALRLSLSKVGLATLVSPFSARRTCLVYQRTQCMKSGATSHTMSKPGTAARGHQSQIPVACCGCWFCGPVQCLARSPVRSTSPPCVRKGGGPPCSGSLKFPRAARCKLFGWSHLLKLPVACRCTA